MFREKRVLRTDGVTTITDRIPKNTEQHQDYQANILKFLNSVRQILIPIDLVS